MTVKMTQGEAEREGSRREPPGPRTALLARAALFIERLAPIATLVAAPIALIVVASLFDVWISTPRWAHAAALLAAVGLSFSIAWRRRRA
ncbi:MAG: hypothetical protein HXY21_13900, partial [Parvularculaceae bacterium]|nr:hypothetical protein [Parvularculaceae bacterium]